MIGSPSEAKNYTSSISVASKDGNEIYIRKGPVFTLDDDFDTVMENDSIFKIKYSFAKQMFFIFRMYLYVIQFYTHQFIGQFRQRQHLKYQW